MSDADRPHPVSLDDMIEEIRRECAMRRDVYGRACREGRMNRRRADWRIRVMDEVLQRLEGIREHERGAMDDRG
jgi:hypothetical protein